MTVVLITHTQNWLGLSSDTKPSNPPASSTFHETDTGDVYIFDGDVWTQDLRMISAVSQGYAL